MNNNCILKQYAEHGTCIHIFSDDGQRLVLGLLVLYNSFLQDWEILLLAKYLNGKAAQSLYILFTLSHNVSQIVVDYVMANMVYIFLKNSLRVRYTQCIIKCL